MAAYGPVRAVDGVSLNVPTGSITAVLGANGAGKSSLLRAVSGIVRPRSGRVLFQGEDITRSSAENIVRRGLAPVLASRIMALIGELREKAELTVLLVEQNAKSALGVADRGVVLGVGRVVAEDDSQTLAADDKLRHAYLGF